MEFTDLHAEYESIKTEIDAAVARVIERADFILGEDVPRLEAEVADFCGVRHGVALNSGTDALALSLEAMGVTSGDEVITPAFTFIATAEVVSRLGAKPVFVDIDPTTYNLDPTKLPSAFTPKTKAIIPVHLYGHPADLDPILALANTKGIPVVEDAAQAIGARYGGRTVGSFGLAGCLSFYPAKNLGAYGDAGMVLTNDEPLADRLRMLRNHGSRRKYEHEFLGVSSRLDTLQAAILRAKLPHLTKWNATRRERAAQYAERLRDIPGLTIPPMPSGEIEPVFQQFTIRVPRRDELAAALRERGIPTAIHYPKPLHLQPAYASLGYREGDFPEAERACREVLSLPMSPFLKETDLERIASAIRRFYGA